MTSELSPLIGPPPYKITIDYDIILVHRRGGDNDNWVEELDEIVIGKFFGRCFEIGGTFVRYKVEARWSEELMRELKERGYMALYEVD